MSKRLSALGGFALAATIISSCTGDRNDREITALSKLSPLSVSSDDAWTLFDRSAASAFTPGAGPVTVRFAHPELLDEVKVLGPAPYRLDIRGAANLGFKPIDLSNLSPGWHAFTSSAPVRAAQVDLVFTPTTKAGGSVPELELWTSEGSEDTTRPDFLAASLPEGYASFTSTESGHQLAAGECREFPLTIGRPSTQFARAYLAYHATGAFRPFALEYSINSGATSGASWLSGDTQTHAFTDEIGPGTLSTGANTVRICVPAGASEHVDISDVRVIGEIDRGRQLVASVRADGAQSADAAIDGSLDTSLSLAAHRELTLQLTRLVAPDAILLKGSAISDSMSADCLDRAGGRTPLHAEAFAGGEAFEGEDISCAALAISFDAPVSISELAVVGSGTAERVDWPRFVITSAAEHFGGAAWVGGFTVRPATEGGAVTLDIAGENKVTGIGRFGGMIHRAPSDAAAPWKVDVTAQYPDGRREVRTLVLARDASGELSKATATAPATTAHDNAIKYSTPEKAVVVKVSPSRATSIQLGTLVGANVPAGAVGRPTDITIRHLPTASLPPLDPGMINVTAPSGHGYEFLPHGQHFAKAIDAMVPFDPALIPSTRTANDVRTYYYNTTTKHWEPLTRTSLDVADHVVHNATDHFTVMVNAVLAVPTTPTPLSLDPTSLSGIPAASPGAGIDVVEPPSASSNGDARLSYPIHIPAGRGFYSPTVSLNYSSSNENGWLGLGWSVPVSSIEIDTKWGVPTYADGEELRYLLDGAQLVPETDTDGPGCSSGPTGRRYHTRAEGSFTHILRCGTDPSSYWWELIDRNGTKYTYGGTTSANTGGSSFLSTKPRPATCSGTCPPGVYRWFVHTVTDVHSNTTTYTYLIDNAATTEPGRDVLPSSIAYTSHGAEAAQYTVSFIVDGAARTDTIVNGRGGFKQYTRRLLHSIRIKYGSSVIREYVLTYTKGMFEKSTLTTIQHFGEGGCASLGSGPFTLPTCTGALDQHTFTYVSDPGNTLQSFSAVQPWTGMQADNAGVSSGYDTTVTGSLSLSDPTDSATIGVNGSWGSRTNTTGLYDLNGDGLPDQLMYATSGINAGLPPIPSMNKGEIAGGGSGAFALDAQGSANQLPALGFENHGSWGVDARVGIRQDGFGASVSQGFSEATSRAKKEVADVDGDGYVDYVDAAGSASGQALLGGPDGTGHQQFLPNPFGVLSMINASSDPLLGSFNTDIKLRAIPAAPVAQWVAPYTGTINFSASAQLFQDLAPGDDVTVAVYDGDTWLGGATLTSAAAPWTFSKWPMNVTAGDTLYLVVKTGTSEGSTSTSIADKVTTFIDANYLSAQWNVANPTQVPMADALTPTNAAVFSWDQQEDFRVLATRPLTLPSTGTMNFSFTMTKQTSAADIRWCLQQFPHDAASTDVPCDSLAATNLTGATIAQATSTTNSFNVTNRNVNAGDKIVLRAEGIRTNTNNPIPVQYYSIDPSTITFSLAAGQGFAYTQACEPGSGSGCTMSTDPDLLAEVNPNMRSFGVFLAAVSPPEPLGAVPLTHQRLYQDLTYTVQSFTNPFGTAPIYIALRSNVRGTDTPQYCASATCMYPGTFLLGGPQGEWLSFEITAAQPESAFPLSPMVIQIQATSRPVESIPVVLRTIAVPAAKPTPFVGNYRSWGYAFWNERKAFMPDELLDVYAAPDTTTRDAALTTWCNTQTTCQTNCLPLSSPESCERADVATAALSPIPAFTGTPLAGSEPTWIADGGDAFVNTVAMYPADVGGGGFGAGAIPDGGLFENQYLRLSGTNSHYIGVDVSLRSVPLPGSLSGSVGQSATNTTTDLVDVNGDGVLDAIAGNGTWAGHISTTPGPQLTGLQFNDPVLPGFRKRTGYDYSVSLNGLASFPGFTSGGRYLAELVGMVAPDSLNYTTSPGLSFGRTQQTQDLIDINGDGLPDLVSRSGTTVTVRYNFGNSLGAAETFGTVDGTMNQAIDGYQSTESTLGLDTTSNALEHETTLTEHDTTTLDLIYVKLTKTTNTASNRTTRMLVDLNGDGLPDLVKKKSGQNFTVEYNRGGSFGASKTFTTPTWTYGGINLLPTATSGFASAFTSLLTGSSSMSDIDVIAGGTRSISTSRAAGVSIPLGLPPVVDVGINFSYQRSSDHYEIALMDINGDGAPDHVLRKAGDPNLYVKLNKLRSTANLLTTVQRPLGGTITLTYGDAGNTTDMPQRRKVLQRVDVDDGVDMGASYASPTQTTSFSYQNGFFNRLEKQFMGFATVTTTYPANRGTLVQTFENRDIRGVGHVIEEVRTDTGNNLLSDRVTTWVNNRSVIDSTSHIITYDPACVAALPDLLKREANSDACTTYFVVSTGETTTTYDGGLGKGHTISDTSIDNFGNVLTEIDTGDNQISTDDSQTTIGYLNDTAHWILGRPTSLTIADNFGPHLVRRSRTGVPNPADSSELQTITVNTGAKLVTTTLGYDAYGNLNHLATPPNTGGDVQTYDITFDTAVHTYPTRIVNAFGEASTATYDVRYGVATLETDVSGNSLTRTLDTYGRLATASGPYDTSGPGITFEYHPETSPPSAITVTHPSAPSDFTGTLPTPITAVTFEDGLRRTIELRRTSNVGGVAGMTTSAMANRDTAGRVVNTYQPFFTAGPSTAFVAPVSTFATTVGYDASDRIIQTTYPDGHGTSTVFSVAAYPISGAPVLFQASQTDPDGHKRELYTDVDGRTRAFTEHKDPTPATTVYDYTCAGDLSKIVDAENNTTTITYDWRGLRTQLISPDQGTVTDTYDDMGNHATHQDAVHLSRGANVNVTYAYDHDRLHNVIYTTKPTVTYNYSNGRLASVSDETGSQTFTYGALGEMRRVLRTVTRLDSSTATFDTHFTTDSLGRQLQVIYPDGTTIANTYDEGGALATVTGSGSGWSKTYADQIQYDVFGNRTHLRYGNNVTTTSTYEPQRVRLSTVTTQLPSGPNVQQLTYGYDSETNPTSIVNSVPALTSTSGMRPGPTALTLSYDNTDQLKTASAATGWVNATTQTTYDETFNYSPSHNISSKIRNHYIAGALQPATSFNSTYTYTTGHPPHLPTSIGATSISYDPSGNPLTRVTGASTQTLTWDDDNRLSTITTSSYTETNKYDASGLRVLRQGGDQNTVFANQYFDLEGTAGGEKYVFAGASRIATVLGDFPNVANPPPPTTSGTAYYLHPDYLGSTGVVTTEAGDAQESHDYFVDGELWIDHTSSTPVNGYMFEGKPYDKLTGFYDYGQRFYDPRTSLWLGEDPAFTGSPSTAIGRPVMAAVSAFSDQNPAAHLDPDGRDSGWGNFISSSPREENRRGMQAGEQNVPQIVRDSRQATAPYMATADVTQSVYDAGAVGVNIGLDMTPVVGTVRAFARGDYVGGALSLVGDLSFGYGMLAKGASKLPRAAATIRRVEKAEKDASYVYRELSAEDRALFDAGKDIKAKGTGGTIAEHVKGGADTKYISASETIEGTQKYTSGNGLIRIDVDAAQAAGSGIVCHANVCQSVASALGRGHQAYSDAVEAREVLFKNFIPNNACTLIGQ